MELFNQPLTGRLGDRLIELLDAPEYFTLNVLVAFAKNSGVLRIKNALEKFRDRGGLVNVYVGVDLGGTTYEALTSLRLLTDSLTVVHFESGQTFHTKIYNFVGNTKGLAIVGSHNLTGGGLWSNFESSVIITTNRSDEDSDHLQRKLDQYIEGLTSLGNSIMPIHTQDDIDRLLENQYVYKEVVTRILQANNAANNESRERLFGENSPVKLPPLQDPPSRPTPAAVKPQGTLLPAITKQWQTIWFYSGRMTGGSRNILDLSKKALVDRGDPTGTPFDLDSSTHMRGGVEFFGLNPGDTEETKNITINFEGIDYYGNTILFPVGPKSNMSWRLQIKGVAPPDRHITEAFATKGEEMYLVKKILTFTRVQEDYYFLSVYPASELDTFIEASRISAYNGRTRTSRRFGLL